jgi:hypothetical protein
MVVSDITCPLKCMNRDVICESPPDWLEKHSTFLLTFIGAVGGAISVLLAYCIKSRCKKIKCFGIECDRTPVDLEAKDIDVKITKDSPKK